MSSLFGSKDGKHDTSNRITLQKSKAGDTPEENQRDGTFQVTCEERGRMEHGRKPAECASLFLLQQGSHGRDEQQDGSL